MPKLSQDEIDDLKDVFELFDFWDGRDGAVDAFKLGDVCRCLGINPRNEDVFAVGGTHKMGEKSLPFEEFLPAYEGLMDCEQGTFADYMEAFKTFDREGQGFISGAELRHVLTALGERLSDEDVDEIIRLTDLQEDLEGNVKYEDFVKKVMAGPYPDK
ncbi:myosin essential light chain, striated adductor muscle [Pecten maximus]|uniref:Sulfhydryl light chain n=1 Tax=Pecten maximus TaxID=6579 RepID=Q9U7E2_PECMA|nr:myosin essential light chain, striated adductor muscle [Pecten maximus]AAD52843.1 myosin essential light chain [Pecten maximus]